tara:strand:+ start:824 stop:1060 length:237 start_codon:yes stop_codon:yes gene_type:complete
MTTSQKLDENLRVGDVLISDQFKNAENFPRIFKTHKVDDNFGVVYYIHDGIECTVGTSYVRRAKFWERIFAWMMTKTK